VILALAALIAGALLVFAGRWDAMRFMHLYMGFFLCILSMFKFFDPPGFADGFQMYDLLARRVRAYAYVYPLLELGLGLAYFSEIALAPTYIATIVLMSFSAVGVIRSVRRGLDIHCACMGTVLKVPLSTVSILENVGMAMMAVIMLAMTLA
jgi:hypothetical protein